MPDPQVISRQARAAIAREAAAEVQAGVAKAYLKAVQEAARQAKDFANELQKPLDQARQEMFQRLGENAQRSMLSAYGQLVSKRSTVPSYRSGNGRLSGGVLRRAIGSSEFFTATADGLEWGNTAFLDSEARHWHRINFGAGDRGAGGDAKEFPVFGTALGFEEGPSPAFSMPPGFWLGPDGKIQRGGSRFSAENVSGIRGSGAFYPSTTDVSKGGGGLQAALGRAGARSTRRGRPAGWRPTKGIEAANFMNAGLARIARDLPDLYDALTQDLVEGAIKALESRARKSFNIIQGPVYGTGKGIVTKISLP